MYVSEEKIKDIKYIMRNKKVDSIHTKRLLYYDDTENGNYADNVTIL
jgi:hypothetical protein